MAPRCIVVMGVSGSGKTTLAQGLARALHAEFLEGDELHPPANIAKMSRGEALDDDDRRPWLAAIGEWVDDHARRDHDVVLTCSALRRDYRDQLRAGRPGLVFLHVTADERALADRLGRREGHYMPASLLPSQLATLEPLGPDEPGLTLPARGTPDDVLRNALAALGDAGTSAPPAE